VVVSPVGSVTYHWQEVCHSNFRTQFVLDALANDSTNLLLSYFELMWLPFAFQCFCRVSYGNGIGAVSQQLYTVLTRRRIT
jgi:hypothetical protein